MSFFAININNYKDNLYAQLKFICRL